MSYRDNDGCTKLGCIICLLVQVVLPLITTLLIKGELHNNIYFVYSVAASAVVVSIIMWVVSSRSKKLLDESQHEFRSTEISLKREYEKKEKEITAEKDMYKRQIDRMSSVMSSKEPFTLSATLFADMKSYIFQEAADYLQRKPHPAHTTANEIRTFMKKRYVETQKEYKTILYKLEFLLDVFPELKPYVEDDQDLRELALYRDYDDMVENRDRSRDYLTPEEWNSLKPVERSQLALDRWVKSDKSKLVIGLLYEMYISYLLRQKGHEVVEYGIKHGVSDLGRDIISFKDGWTYIYQCKNWSKTKEIHENIVCQLFGTVMEYKIAHKTEKVKAYLIVSTRLSPMAQEFARRLGIEVRNMDLDSFPMIKCNINGTSKIYHLPFDQQYWRTEIVNPGEFYATTVTEAERAGFRRAMRHNF